VTSRLGTGNPLTFFYSVYLIGLGAADDPLDDGGVVVLVVADVVDADPDLALWLDGHDLQIALVEDATLEHLDR
jgi:hypothetical protein